jgi:cell surface protein SprA
VDYNCDALAGIISLRKFISADQAIAVNYITAGPPSDTVGNSSRTVKDPNDTLKLVMKLIRPKGLTSSMTEAWGLMLKNRYPLGPVGISQESFEFRIEYQVPGQNAITEVTDKNINLIKLFGLGGDNVTTNENVFNYVKGITIDETRGEVIFPTVEPFRLSNIIQDLKKYNAFTEGDTSQARLLAFGKIYDTTASGAIIDTNNRYYLRGSVKGGLSSDYNLGFNIVEGSVEVISNGQRLTPGVDYTVDYISGSVKIRNQLYLMPGHDLQIKYEANDLFQLASKSLLGARGELDLGEKTSLGFTIMKYSQQSLSDKVRLGEEPISNTIMGVDGGTTIEAPWLTNALNNVPGIKSTVASQISLRGEAAYIIPNPNTRTSPIASDGSKGVAYIDDFEGARQIIPLGTFYGMWKDASAPWFVSTIDSSGAIGPDGWSISTSDAQINNRLIQADTTKMYYKAKACWFNVYPTDVTIPSIWGDRRSFAEGEGQITSLDFYFLPAVRGPFNYSMHLDSTIGLGKTEPESHIKAWAGIQRVLSTTSTNLVEQNIESIEFWIKVVSPQDGNTSKLNIDLGYISEDVILKMD